MKNNENFNAEVYAHDAPAFLGKHEYARLKEAVHVSQLGLFQEVFLRSLKVLNEVLRDILVESQDNMSLFDQKINELCAAFKRLNNLPDLYSKESETFRNIAVTAFVFYRTLYKGAYAAFMSHHQTKAHFDMDPNILYKRIPYKLYEFLGGQYWRIYEFHMLVDGDLSNLQLNADIKDFIEKVCAEKIQNPLTVQNIQNDQRQSLATNINESVVTLSEQTKKLQMKLFETDLSLQQVKQEFVEWVQKQLDQDHLHLNERGIFSSRLKYGSDLFVEDGILYQFSSLYQKDIKILRQILRASAGGKIYKVSSQEKVIETYRISGLQFIDAEFNPKEIEEESQNEN